MELPEDCWFLIFNAVDHYRHFEFLSLVSRRFLSITNHLRRSLTITDKLIPFLPNLLCRFPNIDEINVPHPYFHGDLDELLRQISASNIVLRSISLPKYQGFPIEGLRHLGSTMGSSLRILNCSAMSYFKRDDIVTIANVFPFLEELDISHVVSPRDFIKEECLSDDGIRQMSLHLKELRKINLSGNWFLTDESIISLSSNCLLLEELEIRCRGFTMKGIGMALRDCHHLNSISASLPYSDKDISKSDKDFFSKSLAYATNLRELDLDFRYVSPSVVDGFLSDLAEANLPLAKLKFSSRRATYRGFSNLLHKYDSLISLDVKWPGFLISSDQKVADVSKFLKNITRIKLIGCPKLTSSGFFTIIRSCPFLSNITMLSTNIGGIEEFETTDFAVNRRVKKLGLSDGKICDEFLKKVAFTCPNLEISSFSYCRGITVEGINAVLRNCREIKKLKIYWCPSVSKFNIDIQLPNLEDLRVKELEFDDKSLEIIRERCSGLLHLHLEDCRNVSGNAVIEVAKKCRKLRKINLRGCRNGVHMDTIVSLVSSRSSLRTIVLPHKKMKLTKEYKDMLFLPHITCQLYD